MSAAAGRAGLAALLALVVLAPLPLAANRPWAWSLLALLLGLLLAWRRPALPGRALRLAALGFAAVLAWSLVQTLPLPAALAGLAHPVWGPAAAALPAADWRSIGLAPPDGWAAALRLAAYGCAFWLALGLARGGDAAAPAAALALAGAVYGAYGLAVTLSGSHTILWWPKWHYHDVVTATFVNRNTFATWAGTCLLAAVALVLDPARPGRRAVWLLCAAVAAAALAGSGSRAGVAATAAGLLALLALEAAARADPAARRRLLLGGLAGLAGLAAAAAAAGVPARLGRALLASDDRWDIYRITLRALLDRPLLGHGHGGYPHLFHLYADPTLSHIVFDRAHSTYLELAVELGLPAALLLLAALAAPAVLCWRAWRADPAAARPAALALAATLLAALHSAIDFSLQTPAAAVAYAALLGAGASCYRPARPQR